MHESCPDQPIYQPKAPYAKTTGHERRTGGVNCIELPVRLSISMWLCETTQAETYLYPDQVDKVVVLFIYGSLIPEVLMLALKKIVPKKA